MKTALITGAAGQDGSYLSELLAGLGYAVHGTYRPSVAAQASQRPDHLTWHECDSTDCLAVRRLVDKIKPDEVYNLAAQSHVASSFENPVATFHVNAMGALYLLESLRGSGARFYQASTSELFGAQPPPQNEDTPFHPRSPYGVAKLAAYWLTVNYREAYGLHASNGILFNHESPRRGANFVTQKIARAVARGDKLTLGNTSARRDWGHAKDFVRGMHLIVQQEMAGDYVLATGQMRSIGDFISEADKHASGHLRPIEIETDPALWRPAEVWSLCGDASKAKHVLGWVPEITFEQLVKEMVDEQKAVAGVYRLRPAGSSGLRRSA